MEFRLIPALLAGLMATVVATLFMELVSRRRTTSMPSMPLLFGSALSGDYDAALLLGTGIHYALYGTTFCGIGYGLVISAIGSASWFVGAALGLVHGAVVGVILGFVGAFHPRLVEPLGMGPAERDRRASAISVDPGIFGVNWGSFAPVLIMASHATYGLVFAAVYSSLA